MSKRDWIGFAFTTVYISAIALQIGTQFVAWKYDYQPNLGWYMFDLPQFNMRVYPPWSIILWALNWWDLFEIKLGVASSVVIFGFFVSVQHKAGVLPWQGKKDDVTDAEEWGTEDDLKKRKLLDGKVHEGVVLGMLKNSKLVTYRGDESVLFDGGTGVGKSAAGIIPSILSANSNSMIILDPKGELWDMTGRWRSTLGSAAYLDPVCPNSLCINPFSTVRFGTEQDVRDVTNLIQIATTGTGIRADDAKAEYYQRRTIELLTGMALYVGNDLGKKVTFGGLRKMIPVFEKTYLPDMQKSKHEEVLTSARNFERYAVDTRGFTLQGASDVLAVFKDAGVCRVTEESDFDINDLMAGNEPITLYLRSRFSDQDRLRPLMLLINRYIISKLLYAERECDDGRKKARSLDLILEEIGDARDSWIISRQIVIRSSGMRIVMAAQSMKLLKRVYGTLNTIDENCFAIVRYANIGQDEQTVVSGDAGQKVETVKRISRKHGILTRDHEHTVSESDHKAPLLTRADVRGLPDDRQILTVKGCRPSFLLYKPTWYEHPILKTRGDNVRGGAEKPGQMPWVLDMHRARAKASKATVEAANDPGKKTIVGIIADRTGWDAEKINYEVFKGEISVKFVAAMMRGTKDPPQSRDVQAQRWLDKYEREKKA